MWERRERKIVYTLDVESYAPEITALTRPWLEAWARRIGAELVVIGTRQFPDWPVVYEKLQIYTFAQELNADWNIYVDSDALIHPDTPDFTLLLPRDTVAHNDSDMAAIRWDYDRFFQRDGRNLGSGNWLAIASSWCIELWKPLDDLTCAEAVSRIHPTAFEARAGVSPHHLIDDYVLSRNIAKYGLKFQSVKSLQAAHGVVGDFFRHDYLLPTDAKVSALKQVLTDWKL